MRVPARPSRERSCDRGSAPRGASPAACSSRCRPSRAVPRPTSAHRTTATTLPVFPRQLLAEPGEITDPAYLRLALPGLLLGGSTGERAGQQRLDLDHRVAG